MLNGSGYTHVKFKCYVYIENKMHNNRFVNISWLGFSSICYCFCHSLTFTASSPSLARASSLALSQLHFVLFSCVFCLPFLYKIIFLFFVFRFIYIFVSVMFFSFFLYQSLFLQCSIARSHPLSLYSFFHHHQHHYYYYLCLFEPIFLCLLT